MNLPAAKLEQKVKHTPGPWFVVHDELCETPFDFDVCAETEATDKQLVARVRIVPPVGDVEANAYLIAAAPEMLEALDELLAVSNIDPMASSIEQESRRAVAQSRAEAAIRKAKGEL